MTRRLVAWLGFIVGLALVAAVATRQFCATPRAVIAIAMWACALACLLVTANGAMVGAPVVGERDGRSTAPRRRARVRALWAAALVLGVATATLQLIVLMMRVIAASVDLVTVYVSVGPQSYGFEAAGLWSFGLVFAAALVAWLSTGAARLPTCLFLIALMATFWVGLLPDVFVLTPSRALRMTGGTLVLTGSLALLLAGAGAIRVWYERRRPAPMEISLDGLLDGRSSMPGFAVAFGTAAAVLILLIAYHLAVPIGLRGGYRVNAIVLLVSSSVAAGSTFMLAAHVWRSHLADAAMGLLSLAVASLAVVVIPVYPESLAERYALVLNALMVGFAISAGGCAWLADFWRRCADRGVAGTTAGRLVLHAKRFVFLNGTLALVAGGLMALWPRLSSIGVPDDSIERVTAGFGANLFLLMVLLWCARRLRRPTLHWLTLLALLSTTGFMVMRMIPYSPSFH